MNISFSNIIWAAILSLLPISELRGGIPFSIANGMPWYAAWALCAGINALVAPITWIFLSTFHKLFLKIALYERLFTRFVEKARIKLKNPVEKYGALGIAVFVAIPLPITGAWTGTLGAWVLGLSKRKTFFSVILGVVIAGGIVTAVTALGIEALRIFLK